MHYYFRNLDQISDTADRLARQIIACNDASKCVNAAILCTLIMADSLQSLTSAVEGIVSGNNSVPGVGEAIAMIGQRFSATDYSSQFNELIEVIKNAVSADDCGG